MEERNAELLAVPYFHVVFTLPARIAAIGYQNKAVIYDLLFKAWECPAPPRSQRRLALTIGKVAIFAAVAHPLFA